MSDQTKKQRTDASEEENEELEDQNGEELPKREMMSILPVDLDPTVPPPID